MAQTLSMREAADYVGNHFLPQGCVKKTYGVVERGDYILMPARCQFRGPRLSELGQPFNKFYYVATKRTIFHET